MTLLINEVTKEIEGTVLFKTTRLRANAGARIGIIGANGAGKTTLARMISGQDQAYTGQISGNRNVLLVPQLPPSADKSGGQKVIALIRSALAANPAILILDEPSANLDEGHQSWLRQQLIHFQGTLLLISHDRALLDDVVQEIWAVRDHRFQSFTGNFTAYEKARSEAENEAKKAYRHEQRVQHELALAAQKRKEKAVRVRKGSRRMGNNERQDTKSARELNAAKLERSAKAMAVRAERQLKTAKPTQVRMVKLVASELPPLVGKYVLRVADLTLARGSSTLLRHATFDLRPGERLAVTGANGVGKTTLLEAIVKRQGGVRIADHTRIGYFHQDLLQLETTRTVDQTMAAATTLTMSRTRQVMGAFGLPARFYDRLVRELSGGERVKLQLLTILVSASNCLILDEPTNFLDLPALQALTVFLQNYPGSILFVSHDQVFREAVATRSLNFVHQQLVDPVLQTSPRTQDISALRFAYDKLLADPDADPAELQALHQKLSIAQKGE
ncbi:ABC-F family ATP-binding cassette domain-containing protein [Lacticaseibacillus sp. 53-4]|uniref:ABC-F family ATP-binding cassette domain-containing protein n=1 Tax=Lacticaseibacillus sp. 53-4 TaxID=2799575 RepID=UPI001942D37C|nr:ATP-binding cassette domain-containing protein [Lacticaseibacillus sp. 53-4]